MDFNLLTCRSALSPCPTALPLTGAIPAIRASLRAELAGLQLEGRRSGQLSILPAENQPQACSERLKHGAPGKLNQGEEEERSEVVGFLFLLRDVKSPELQQVQFLDSWTGSCPPLLGVEKMLRARSSSATAGMNLSANAKPCLAKAQRTHVSHCRPVALDTCNQQCDCVDECVSLGRWLRHPTLRWYRPDYALQIAHVSHVTHVTSRGERVARFHF